MSKKEKCCVHIAHDCHAGDGCRVVERMKAAHKPPQRTWVGLTDEEITSIFKTQRMVYNTNGVTFARAIEAKLKEKNL
jgi:hypothetical protein